MAHYHFHVNPGPKGTGADHAQYIAREGRFKEEKYGEIGEKESGNLPEWARGRRRGSLRRRMSMSGRMGIRIGSLSSRCPSSSRMPSGVALVREFVPSRCSGHRIRGRSMSRRRSRHNPHVHIMFSERQLDGIERGPEQYFKRANGKNPERGGHAKSIGSPVRQGPEAVVALRAPAVGRGAEPSARARGVDARVDHRSLEAQGIDREADAASGAGGERDRGAGGHRRVSVRARGSGPCATRSGARWWSKSGR